MMQILFQCKNAKYLVQKVYIKARPKNVNQIDGWMTDSTTNQLNIVYFLIQWNFELSSQSL